MGTLHPFAGFAFTLAVMSADPVAAPEAMPSATSLIDRYLETRGGQAALDRLQVVERIGWISVDAGDGGLMAGSYHTCVRYPDRVAIEIDAAPWRVAQALRADAAYECAPGFTHCRHAGAEAVAELEETARFANKDLLDHIDAWRAGEVSASEDGRAWRITIDAGRWAEFDRMTGHLHVIGVDDRWRRLGQWREVEGVTFPHRLEDYLRSGTGRPEWRNTVQLREIHVAHMPSAWCAERFEG